MAIEFRRFEKLEGDNFVACELRALRVGDRFRIFEPDGEPVGGGKTHRLLAPPLSCDPAGNFIFEVE